MPFVDLVLEGEVERVRAAIDAGAPLETVGREGLTPLLVACREGFEAIARVLIDRGARLDFVGPRGETALGLAMLRCPRLAEHLVERGVLGRPLRPTPSLGQLALKDCDVCARYADAIDVPGPALVEPAWLELVEERKTSGSVERSLRCVFCGTRYEQSKRDGGEQTLVRAPGPPAALLGALFVAEDGRHVLRVVKGDAEAPYLTTVWSADGSPRISSAHTEWLRAKAPRSESAHDRLDHLRAELSVVGAGNTFTFYVVRRNLDLARFGDKEWISALPGTALEDLRLFPEFGTSPYVPDDYEFDDQWWMPYSTFRAATDAERSRYVFAAK